MNELGMLFTSLKYKLKANHNKPFSLSVEY